MNACQSAAAIRSYVYWRENEAIRDQKADCGERKAGTRAIKLDTIKKAFIFFFLRHNSPQ